MIMIMIMERKRKILFKILYWLNFWSLMDVSGMGNIRRIVSFGDRIVN